MSTEDKKVVELFTIHGGQFGVLTRMPHEEINRELYERPEQEWIHLHGLSELDEPIDVKLSRSVFCGGIIRKWTPKRVMANRGPIQ